MKKFSLLFFSTVVAIVSIFGMASCSGGKKEDSNSESSSTTPETVYYTITFDLETDVEVKVVEGEAINVDDIPTAEKDGWEFLGWYLNGAEFDFTTAISSDITLTPKYQEIISETVYYTITFDLETDVEVKVVEGEAINVDDIPTAEKDGWEFLGWYLDGTEFDFDTPIDRDITLTPEYSEILGIRLNEYAGGDVSLLPEAVRGYLECKTESEIAEYLYQYQEEYVRAGNANGLELAFASNVAAPYEVYISQSENFANAVIVETVETSISVYNLVPATYYWKVLSADGYESVTDSFVVADSVRMINCGNIVNMRDEGGWTGELGAVKYGMVYRSAAISESDEDKESANEAARKVLLEDLKIATEIDLRLGDKTQTISPLINKENCGIVYMDPMFPGLNESRPFVQSYADALKKAFLLFTDESNYPINYHCAIGADRTGTFSLLLGGLLGLSYEDLATNFEISSFYQGKRWRSAINVNGGVYSFDESGVMQDNGGSNFICSFGKCYNYVMATYGTGDGKTSTAFANYFKTVVGLSDSDIEKIRSIMLESYENSFESVESQTYASADVTFDKTLNSVSAVYVNGVKLSANDYAVSNNRLTVKKAYVDTLQTWKNHVSVEYDGGKFVSEILIYTHISDYAGLQAISENPYGYYILDADIDCGNGALVLGDFYGVLDGNGHMIKNVKNSSYWGKIFNSLHINAVIKNVGFYNITNTFLIGDLDGKLQNVSFVQLSGTIIAPIASTKKGFCNIENFIVYASNVSVSGLVNGGTLGQYNNVYVFTNKEHEYGMYVSTMWGLTGETGTDYVETDAYKALDFTAIFDFSKDGVWMMDETLGIPVVGELPKEVETFTGESHTYQEKDIIVNDIPFVDIGTVVINGVELVENDYVIDENGLTIKAAYIELLADWKNAISVISVDETKVYNAELLKYAYISNYAELKAVADAATTEAPAKGYYILTQDIDCENQELYFQSFSGVLDGNGHTISNSKNINKNYAAVFTYINAGAIVKNIGFYNVSTIRNNGYSYGLVYTLEGTLSNVSFHQNKDYLMVATIGSAKAGCSISNFVVYAQNATVSGFFNSGSSANIEGEANIYIFANISNKNSTAVATSYFATGESRVDYLETDEYKAIDFTAIFDCSEDGIWTIDETLGIPLI